MINMIGSSWDDIVEGDYIKKSPGKGLIVDYTICFFRAIRLTEQGVTYRSLFL